MLQLKIPDDLKQAPQPFLFREWFLGSPVRRWMEYERRNDHVTRLAGPGPGRRILDVGCDWGYACMSIARSGAEAWGVDIDRDAIAYGLQLAEANGIGIHLSYAHARRLPFADRRFDAITAIETIEHIPSAELHAVFQELSRVLKPGGVVVLSTPNPVGLTELAKRALGRSRRLRRRFYGSYHDEGRTRVLPGGDLMVDGLVSPADLKRALAGTGLALARADYIVFVSKFLPAWLLAPAKAAEWVLERTPLVRRLASTSVYLLDKVC